MRYLIVSDLHSNWEALEAVVADAKGAYERVICCGDVVGYGPDPNRVVEWTRANAQVIVRGNHDRVCCGMEDLEWFNEIAQKASRWTMAQLKPENFEWLRSMPKGPVVEGDFQIVHGSPLDEDEYVSNLSDAANVLPYLESDLTFFGHTHLQGGFLQAHGRRSSIAAESQIRIEEDAAHLVNPGSVGQPRDGDVRAAYALYDTKAGIVSLRRVAYDFDAVASRIEEAGLPAVLGTRLAIGR